MIKYEDIRRIHLEPTDKCNARCPMCIRNIYGGPTNPNVQHIELNLKDIKKIFEPKFIKQLVHMYCCGNTGDPMMNSELISILEYFRENNYAMSLGVHSNASGRSHDWWYNLGKLLSKAGDYVRFSIDGLEDTNHIYRRGTNWNKIIESINAFVSAGGIGIWEFIPFKHNQHQVKEAENLAKKLGLRGFQVIKSGRFIDVSKTEGDMVSWKNAQPVYTTKGVLEYIIEPADKDFTGDIYNAARSSSNKPSNPRLLNHVFDDEMTNKYFKISRDKMYFPNANNEIGKLPILDNVQINCRAAKDRCIYVSAEGLVFPCCWTAYQLYQLNLEHATKQMRHFIWQQGLDNINALKKPFKEIIDSNWIKNRFDESWKKKSIREGKLSACAVHCSEVSHIKNEYDIKEVDLRTKVAFIGLGKLGAPAAESMLEAGYMVMGYDITDVDCNIGQSRSIKECIEGKDYIFIAVPTPHAPKYGGSRPTSDLPVKGFDYKAVIDVLKEIELYVTKQQTIILISTVLPGVVRHTLTPIIHNARFIYNPYLIAMGTVKEDMAKPEMIIIGSENGNPEEVSDLINFYRPIVKNNPRYEIGTWDEAECIKIFYNTFISTKLALVNMIQDVAEKNRNIDTDIVTNALAKSTQRIISSEYMKAGMGDGGPCHPRDNIALSFLAKDLELNYDLFKAIMYSREVQAKNMAKRLMMYDLPIVILGKSFKPDVSYTDGSYSLLVGHYIEEVEKEVYYDNDPDIDGPFVYLLGHRKKFYDYSFFPDSLIIDPWRECPVIKGCSIIYYGNTRKEYENIKLSS